MRHKCVLNLQDGRERHLTSPLFLHTTLARSHDVGSAVPVPVFVVVVVIARTPENLLALRCAMARELHFYASTYILYLSVHMCNR